LAAAVSPLSAGDGLELPELIRVRLSVAGANLKAVLPEGTRLVVDGRETALPTGEATVSVGAVGWRLAVPANAPFLLQEVEGSRRDGGSETAGVFSSRRSAERVRRILRAEFDVLPGVARAGWHISVNSTLVGTEPVPLEFIAAAEAGTTISLNGRHYRGDLRLEPAGAGYVVTNVLPLEEYLYSVVGSEMPSGWELEALKAQAVAARTYALRQVDPNAAFDICDSTACQAYRGIQSETPWVREAVEATRGIIATYEGDPIDAVYSANMGGQTAASEDVWSNFVPYLRSVESPFDNLALKSGWAADDYEWELALTPSQLLADLRHRGYDLTSLEGVSVIADDGGGRATAVEIRGRPVVLTIYRDEIRYALGVKSTIFDVSTADESRELLVVSFPGGRLSAAPTGSRAGGYRRSISFDEAPAMYRLSNGAVFTTEILVPAQIIVRGRGVGHGVGMSQWGAQGMALAGEDYEAILKHFFTGIELTQAG
jgi:stage II sporulation protein D